MFENTTARTLGFTSIAIGLTEILFPKRLEKTMGIGNGENTGILRTLGVREIMHGVDLLTHEDPTPGVWARVAGDMLDGALLAAAARKTRNPGGFAAIAALVAPVVAADIWCAAKLTAKKAG
jgi:hypothetical protein